MSHEEFMQPVDGQQSGEMGRYELQDAVEVRAEEMHPDQQVQQPIEVIRTRHEIESHRRRGFGERVRNGLRKTMLVGAGVLAVLVAKEIQEFGPDFDAREKAEISVGPAHSVARTNMFLNLAEITSEFPLEIKTSLDRPGPVNCDMKIIMTDSDEQVRTVSNTGVVFDNYQVNEGEADNYDIVVSGEMASAPTAVAWSETPILFERDLPGFDACFNMDEPNQAMDIAVTTTLQAGQLAAACAIGSEEGERAMEQGLKDAARMLGDIPAETPDEKVTVNFSDLEIQQDAMYGQAVRQFDAVVNAKLDEYIDKSKDHEAVTNFDGIRDCSQHTFEFAE